MYSYYIVKNYRDAHGLFCSNGILLIMSHPEEVKLCHKKNYKRRS